MLSDNAYILFLYFLTGAVGLCLGSFATALIHRIPRNIPWIMDRKNADTMARSCCTACGAKLAPIDLVPLFSWLFLRGKCRHCGARISPFYPMVELATMVLTILLFYAWGFTPASVPLFLAVPFLVAAVVIDWEHMILPDDINLALFVLAVLHVVGVFYMAGWSMAALYDPIFASILLTGSLWLASKIVSKWKGRESLGLGDLKFLPSAGLMLGMAAMSSYLALSGALGVLTALMASKRDKKQAFPFGPALIISLYIHVFLTGLGFDYTW